MIETEHIKKMVAHIIRRQQGVRDREVMAPDREWILGIGVTVLFVCLGGVISYILYLNTINLEVETNESTVAPVPYNNEMVESAANKYREKTKIYNNIRGTVPVPTDIESTTIVTEEESEIMPETVEESDGSEQNESISSSTVDTAIDETNAGRVELDF